MPLKWINDNLSLSQTTEVSILRWVAFNASLHLNWIFKRSSCLSLVTANLRLKDPLENVSRFLATKTWWTCRKVMIYSRNRWLVFPLPRPNGLLLTIAVLATNAKARSSRVNVSWRVGAHSQTSRPHYQRLVIIILQCTFPLKSSTVH